MQPTHQIFWSSSCSQQPFTSYLLHRPLFLDDSVNFELCVQEDVAEEEEEVEEQLQVFCVKIN